MSIDKSMPDNPLNLERRYRLLVESIKDYAIYMLTPEGYVDSWNPGAQHFKGYTSTEIIGQHFSRFYTPEEQAAGTPARNLRIAATEGKFETEAWRIRKDGTRFWAHVVIDPVTDESGRLIGFSKITRDITDKKAAQDALLESERRFRYLVKGVTDYAIYMLSPEGKIADWNIGAERIKGYTADEVVGTHFSRFYTDEDNAVQLPKKALETAIREGKFETEGWRVRKDGTRFWAHVVIDPIYDDTGSLLGFAKITRDITEKKKAAMLLEETQAALLQSRKMDAIGKLTGGIAHDFNNLLQGVMGNLDLMRLRIALGQIAELGPNLDAAMLGIKRSAALTHRLLAFARRQTLAPKPVDATWLVHSMMDMLRRTVGPDIVIESKVQDGLWWTLCDQNQLENALLNLVINARDAMLDGGTVTIETRNLTEEEAKSVRNVQMSHGEYVILSVIDTGTGMAPDVIEQAFEPFFTTKPLGEGTGLGLSMVHGFIRQSGGYIGIESEVGKGTVVNLYLPRHVATDAAQETDGSVQVLPPVDNKRVTVLMVDDEVSVRTMLTEMLRQFGYDTLSAEDGHEGLKTLAATPHVDLLITDIGLPGGMTGRQFASAARKLRPDLKVMFITGYTDQTGGNETLSPGMQMLIKPFNMETFIAAVQDMTSSEQSNVTRF